MLPLNDAGNQRCMESANNGITKLKASVQDLSNSRLKLKDREILTNLCCSLYDEYKTTIFNGSHHVEFDLAEFVSALFEDVVRECSENEAKLEKAGGTSAIKSTSFTLFVRVVRDICCYTNTNLIEEHSIPVLAVLVKLACRPIAQLRPWMQDTVTELLLKYLSDTKMSALDTKEQKQLWERIWRQFSSCVFKSGSSATNYLQIVRHLIRDFRMTFLRIDEREKLLRMTETILNALESKDLKSSGKTLSRHILELLVCIIDIWGLESRSCLLERCVLLANGFLDRLSIDASDCDADLADAVWSFVDRVTSLAIPDCNPNGIVHREVYVLAAGALQILAKNLLKLSFHRPSFVIPADKVPLLSKLIVITEVSESPPLAFNMTLTQQGYSQSAKRKKEITFMEFFIFHMLVEWDFDFGGRTSMNSESRPELVSSCLILLNNCICTYGHRLSSARLRDLSASIWRQQKKTVDCNFGPYCRLLSSLIEVGAMGDTATVKTEAICGDPMQDPRVRIKAMWQYAVVAVNSQSAAEAALELMRLLLLHFKQVIGDDDEIVETVSAVLAKSESTFGFPLLINMLTDLEFDERRSFHGVGEKLSGIEQWRFRCQIADWLIKHFVADISSLLYVLCCYHPDGSTKPRLANVVYASQLQRDIARFGFSNGVHGYTNSLLGTINQSRCKLMETLIIPEMVDYISNLLHDHWFHIDLTDRIPLWQSVLRFAKLLQRVDEPRNLPTSPALESLLKSTNDWLVEVGRSESTSFLEQLDPSPAAEFISTTACAILNERASECPVIYARFPIEVVHIPPHSFLRYLDEAVQLIRAGKAPIASKQLSARVESFASMTDYLPDILLLLRKCGDVISQPSRQHVLDRARNVIAEDKNSQETTEIDTTLAVLLLSDVEFILDPSIHKKVSTADVLQNVSIEQLVSHIDCIELTPSVGQYLLMRAAERPLLIMPRLAAALLSDGSLWQIHAEVLQNAIKDRQLFELCMEYTPNFQAHLDFHSVMLAVLDSPCDTAVSFNRALTFLRSNELIVNTKQRMPLSAENFPSAFSMSLGHWPVVTEWYWKLYQTNSHQLLTALRGQVSSHLKLGLHTRLASLLKAMCLSMPNMPDRMRQPYITVVRTMLAAIFQSSLKNSTTRAVVTSTIVAISNIIDTQLQETLIVMSDIISENNDYTDGEFNAGQSLSKLVEAEATLFSTTGQVKRMSSLCLASFYKQLIVVLRRSPDSVSSTRDKGIYLFDRLLLIWEVLPHLRSVIVPLFSIFEESRSQHIRRSTFRCNSIIDMLRDYAHLTILNYRLCDMNAFSACIRMLSCDVFGRESILRAPKMMKSAYCAGRVKLEVDEAAAVCQVHYTNELAQVCDASLTLSIATLGDRPESEPLKVLSGGLMKQLPLLCHLLLPELCGIDGIESLIAVSILEFVFEHAHLLDMSNTSVRRLSRTLCECVDGLGLDVLSQLTCQPSELLMLARIAHDAGFYKHAYAVANLVFDRTLACSNQRALAAVGGPQPEYRDLVILLRDIYVATKDVPALNSLPLWAQNNENVLQLKDVASHRWLRVAMNEISAPSQVIEANWYCGHRSDGPDREFAYMDAILSSKFSQMNYPKLLSTHWARMFVLLYHAGTIQDREQDIPQHMSTFVQKEVIAEDVVDIEKCQWMFHMNLLNDSNIIMKDLPASSLVFVVSKIFRAAARLKCGNTNEAHEYASKYSSIVMLLHHKLLELEAYQACLSVLTNWQAVCPPSIRTHRVQFEICRVKVAMGDYEIAQHQLNEMVKEPMDAIVAVDVMCLLATVAADHSCSMESAVSMMKALSDSLPPDTPRSSLAKMYEQFQALAVRQLMELEAFMESSTTIRRRASIADGKPQVQKMSSSLSMAEQTRLTLLSRELRCEEDDLRRMDNRHMQAVQLAIGSMLKLLDTISPEDLSQPASHFVRERTVRIIFPLLDIIFRYKDKQFVVDELRKYSVSMCPSVWVPAVPHIVSHCFQSDTLSVVLNEMMLKLIVAYPYHVLHTVLAYKFDPAKKTEYAAIVDDLSNRALRAAPNSDDLKKVMSAMSAAHQIYRQFVKLKVDQQEFFTPERTPEGSVKYRLTNVNCIVKHLEFLRRVPIPTLEQKMGIAGDYSTAQLVMWNAIEPLCAKADGQSAPKVLQVQGNDDVWYKMVWKNEDVRQDSLVEHLFEVMSGLLETRQPLRTYRVIPLDTGSGIIEFCSDTVSLKELLVGANLAGGLHHDIEPHEDFPAWRKTLSDKQRQNKVDDSYDLAQFQRILQHVSPVFRHHFYREFPTVEEWTRHINNYTLSLAEWSIVCYVVGLGDRHTSNVLFEMDTSNFVHIDLGMILEFSSRMLPVPEKVPFRLTRDILDPILIQGTKGHLAYTATRAMDKIRRHKEVILGAASVFMRESMCQYRGDSRLSSVSASAAIGRLRDKLNGTDATVLAVTPRIQVERLMSDATNQQNLFDLFSGWIAIL